MNELLQQPLPFGENEPNIDELQSYESNSGERPSGIDGEWMVDDEAMRRDKERERAHSLMRIALGLDGFVRGGQPEDPETARAKASAYFLEADRALAAAHDIPITKDPSVWRADVAPHRLAMREALRRANKN